MLPTMQWQYLLSVSYTHLDVYKRQVFHDATFTCGSSGFTSAMYSVAMGFESNGQELSADQALAGTGQNLERMSAANGSKKLYVDQFLFTDNTPGFEQNAKLKESEKSAYLDGVADIFKAKTLGLSLIHI